MHIIELKDVRKTFGTFTAVDGLSLDVPQNCVYGFIGPNGSGKTTTLRMIMNILIADSGSINIFGEKINPDSIDRIGYMPEERGLYKRMKVRELLLFLGSLKSRKNLTQNADEWLARMDLSEWSDKKVETLSKGMSQKVQFISTIISGPDLVILDEPFSGLDPLNTEVLKDAILDLQKNGATIIFSTHDMTMAEKMCDFIFMIHNGKKVLDGTLNDIQNAYGSDTIRVKVADGAEGLNGLEGVEKVNNYGQQQELRIKEGADPQRILQDMVKKVRLNSFDIVKPSLHDIFIRIARPHEQEVSHE